MRIAIESAKVEGAAETVGKRLCPTLAMAMWSGASDQRLKFERVEKSLERNVEFPFSNDRRGDEEAGDRSKKSVKSVKDKK